MIGHSDIELLNDLALSKISIEEFNTSFSNDLSQDSIFRIFRWAVINKEENLLFSITQYFFKTSFIEGVCCLYNDLLLQDWHRYHDTIAGLLQFDIKDSSSVIYFKESIRLKFDYLFNSDDYEPYVTKCMWGIAKIGGEYSIDVLMELTKSEDEVVRNAAFFQVDRLGLEK